MSLLCTVVALFMLTYSLRFRNKGKSPCYESCTTVYGQINDRVMKNVTFHAETSAAGCFRGRLLHRDDDWKLEATSEPQVIVTSGGATNSYGWHVNI